MQPPASATMRETKLISAYWWKWPQGHWRIFENSATMRKCVEFDAAIGLGQDDGKQLESLLRIAYPSHEIEVWPEES